MSTTRDKVSSYSGWQLDRAMKRLGGWLTGYGLLSLNIGLFLLTATALFLYDLYQHPRDIDVLRQLRFWALLIIFHAVAVTVFWIMSWAVKANQNVESQSLRLGPAPSSTTAAIGSGTSFGGTRFRPTTSTPVMVDEMEQAEHFWRRRSTSILHRHEPGLRDTWRWSISDEAELTRAWPEEDESSSTPTLDTEPTERAGPIPTVGDDVGGVVYDPVELEQTDVDHTDDYEIKPADSVIDPLRFAGRQPESNGNGSEAVLTRWLWVEAAAAAWLAQREDAGIDSAGSYAPPSSNDGDAKAF